MRLNYRKHNVAHGVRQLKTKTAIIFSAFGLLVSGTAVPIALSSTASAAPQTVVYNNIPSPLPGNLVSEAFEAQSASEFGGQVSLAGTSRTNPTVTVVMSSWGCQTGHWYSGDCTTTPGATFSEPITLNVYNVGAGNAPGSLVATQTQTFNIPYRPSASATCGDGRWASGTTCYNGFATPVSFTLTGVTLPNTAIVSVAYNTTHYGYAPIGEGAACYTSGGGCGYDSLNVGLTAPPTVGTDPVADSAYLNSSWTGAYCDNGVAGTGSFRLDSGCWTGLQPAIEVTTDLPLPVTADQCKNNGWMNYGTMFKNQGDCVSYVLAHSRG